MVSCRALAMSGIALGSLPMSGVGQTQLISVTVPSTQALVRQLVAPPGDFIELCTGVKARRALEWQFEAEQPVAFNTHFHHGGVVLSSQGLTAMSAALSAAKGRLVPGGDHEHCWMWTNPMPVPVTIRVQLGR